jgi:Fe-S oxidoreductase
MKMNQINNDNRSTSAYSLGRHPRVVRLTEDELGRLAQADSPLLDVLARWVNKRLTCSDCLRCSRRCEVLETPGLHIGEIEAVFEKLATVEEEQRAAALYELIEERPELYSALRQCCFCGHCTAPCNVHMNAPEKMRVWRKLFADVGILSLDDSKLVMVDNEWHIFSAYRAIYGVGYPEFVLLDELAQADPVAGTATEVGTATEAGTGEIDTLFFPGCSLASYAPDVVRAVGAWLTDAGFSWALSLECCGSPLMSAGLFERSVNLRNKVLEQALSCGIKRVVTVCPGCGEELAEVFGSALEIVPLPELLAERLGGHGVLVSTASESAAKAEGSVTIFDSCHDRFDNRHGTALRQLLDAGALGSKRLLEMPHHGKDTICCGAGGAVAGYDPALTQRRVLRVVDEATETGADTLITVCPTCTYTLAQALLGKGDEERIEMLHYLEMVFDLRIPWDEVFAQLEQMWSGEYGPWLTETFF